MDRSSLSFAVQVGWSGGQTADAVVSDQASIAVALPCDLTKELIGWTPEQLFIASAASCLLAVFVKLASAARLDFAELTVSARGVLEELPTEGLIISTLELNPVLTLEREGDRERAARLLSKAERHCVVSNSMRTRILVQPSIKIGLPSTSEQQSAGGAMSS